MAGLTPSEVAGSSPLIYLLPILALTILIAVGLAAWFLKKKKDSVPKIDEENNNCHVIKPMLNLSAIKQELK